MRIVACGFTLAPSRATTSPSTLTQPFSIHSSAWRREHAANSLTSFANRGDSFASPRVTATALPGVLAATCSADGVSVARSPRARAASGEVCVRGAGSEARAPVLRATPRGGCNFAGLTDGSGQAGSQEVPVRACAPLASGAASAGRSPFALLREGAGRAADFSRRPAVRESSSQRGASIVSGIGAADGSAGTTVRPRPACLAFGAPPRIGLRTAARGSRPVAAGFLGNLSVGRGMAWLSAGWGIRGGQFTPEMAVSSCGMVSRRCPGMPGCSLRSAPCTCCRPPFLVRCAARGENMMIGR